MKILIDQDFDHDILRGLLHRVPNLDFVTAFEVGLNEVHDKVLLRWASAEKRILLTHDRKTMPIHFGELLSAGENLAGVFVVPRNMAIGKAVEELEMIVECSEFEDWENFIRQLPL